MLQFRVLSKAGDFLFQNKWMRCVNFISFWICLLLQEELLSILCEHQDKWKPNQNAILLLSTIIRSAIRLVLLIGFPFTNWVWGYINEQLVSNIYRMRFLKKISTNRGLSNGPASFYVKRWPQKTIHVCSQKRGVSGAKHFRRVLLNGIRSRHVSFHLFS